MAMQISLGRKPKGSDETETPQAAVAIPTSWSVNLLPAETVERQRERALVRRFLVAGAGAVVVVASVWLAQTVVIQMAKADLAAAEDAQATARADLVPLQPIKAFSAAVAQQEQVIGTTMATHTSFADALDSFRDGWPGGSSLRTLDAALGTPCPGADLFAPAASIGCLTWTVTVPGEEQVRDLVADLGDQHGLVSPYLTGATRAESDFDATGTVNFDDRLLTHRFTDQLEETP